MKKRKSITEETVNHASKIIVLTDRKNLPEYVLNSNVPVEFWEAEDPHDMDIEGFKKVIDKIKDKVDALVNKLK